MKYVPYEIKEATLKNFLGVVGMLVIDMLFHPGMLVYSLGTGFFALNWLYRIQAIMGSAIVKMELHRDGEKVTIWYKTGVKKTVDIKNIFKRKHEKELV